MMINDIAAFEFFGRFFLADMDYLDLFCSGFQSGIGSEIALVSRVNNFHQES